MMVTNLRIEQNRFYTEENIPKWMKDREKLSQILNLNKDVCNQDDREVLGERLKILIILILSEILEETNNKI